VKERAFLEGQVALITGSTGEGMGRACALTLADDGADVVLNYGTGRPGNADAAEELASVIEKRTDRRPLIVPADTAAPEQARRLVSETVRHFGRLDILVLASGGQWKVAELPEVEPDHLTKVLNAEIGGAFFVVGAALKVMREKRSGRIIIFGSEDTRSWVGVDDAYMTAKRARAELSVHLSRREWKHGINVNLIKPGPIEHDSDLVASVSHLTPEVFGTRERTLPQDAAEVVRFLCGPGGRFITGAVIPIKGERYD
jgi:3-oxoacyl-[acyl-carrier protein] reductase